MSVFHSRESVLFRSVTQLCPTLWDSIDCSMPGLPVHHQLPEFTQTLVHWVSDAIQSPDPVSCLSTPACNHSQHQFSSVQSLSPVRHFATPRTTAHQATLSITNFQSPLKPMSIESEMPSNHLILCHPLLLLSQSFPASGSFQMSQLFASGGQSTGVSALASFLPKKSQGWSPSEWTGWISLQSKGLSRVFSNTTVQKHQFFCTQLSL